MTDGVLDQELKKKARDLPIGDGRLQLHVEGDPVSEPELLDPEVRLQKLQLLPERRRLLIDIAEGPAEEARKLLDGIHGRLPIPISHQLRDDVEGVEKKVRMDLKEAGPQMTVAAASSLTASASGSGHLHQPGSNMRKFTISAHETARGLVRGQYDLQIAPIGFFRDLGITPPLIAIHGTVTCMTVIGNSAYIGATVDRVRNTDVVFGPAPLTGAAIELIDNDDDPNTPDMISSVVVYQEGVPGQGTPESYCADPSPGPVFPIELGNINVR